ncbi:hypothetical protein Pla175_31250 [Pirellulimonas nuda]|uniref:HEAT repeat protein n=1 Tax=Pirellulimonas nuda TaxID=2528009 RepID=A0A518DE30_9BACT|nr:HEAT repeat domain-containing protein [Pirellulimonas nuda]QDU89730.1 hypothetical protein Pla175_31250 [Pirellulimonas nuda]
MSRSLRLHTLAACLALLTLGSLGAAAGHDASSDFQGWSLEPGIGQAHLVMAARVTRVSSVTVVEGAKTDIALREYRFQPVRVLKGLFQREALSMTASDLGLPAEDASAAPPLKEGELRMLILSQQRGFDLGGGIASYGCVSATPGATTFAQRVPLLSGADDPLVGVVETLIQVADSRSRSERARLLIDRLAKTDGVATVALLTSLSLRADWCASDGRVYEALARLVESPQSAVRGAALDLLAKMLTVGPSPDNPQPPGGVADALYAVLRSDEARTTIRTASIDALGRLPGTTVEADGVRAYLIDQLTDAATQAERQAAATALSRSGAALRHSLGLTPVMDATAALPLDLAPAGEAAYAQAAIRLMPRPALRETMGDLPLAERVWLERLERSLAAGQSIEAEVDALGGMQSKQMSTLLMAAAEQPSLSAAERGAIARALGVLGEKRAAPLLVGWLRGADFRLKGEALTALELVDSPSSADAMRPLLKSESYLPFKLRIARLLARHGVDDGYALAAEHLSDQDHTAAATLVLVALDDPRTTRDLSEILATRPDRRWRAAALTGLAAVGDADARGELRKILADDRDPLVASAAEAVGLSADSTLLPPLAMLARSRNKEIAEAALVALRRFFSGVRQSPLGLAAIDADGRPSSEPAADVAPETRELLASAVADVASDAYVDLGLRVQALAAARLIGGEGYAELLTELADQSELEGTTLLAKVQADRREARRRK